MTDYFVDSAATGANNGTSQANAWTSMASLSGLVVGDRVFIRRSHAETLTASLIPALPAPVSDAEPVSVCGWPISGDDEYSTRPSDPQSWDSDVETHPVFSLASNYQFGFSVGVKSQRIKVSGSMTATDYPIDLSGLTYPSTHKDWVCDAIANSASSVVNAGHATRLIKGFVLEKGGAVTDFIHMESLPAIDMVIEDCVFTTTSTNLIVRAVHYDGAVSDAGMIYGRNIDMSGCDAISSAVLFDCSNGNAGGFFESCLYANSGSEGFFASGWGTKDNRYRGMFAAHLNANQVAGAWEARCSGGDLTKVSDARTGGADFAIKFEVVGDPANGMQHPACELSPTPYETLFVPLSAGTAKTITAYLAENYTTLDGAGVWMEIDYYSAGESVTATTKGDALGSDSSTWSDGTVSAFKLSKSVTADIDCIARVRICVDAYESGKYVLFDPALQF